MVPFVHWLTNPQNNTSLNKTKTVSGETTNEMMDKLRAYVQDKSGVEWTREQAKGKIQYAKKKYDAANMTRLLSAGEDNDDTTLRSRMLAHFRLPGDNTTLDMEPDQETDDIEEVESEDDIVIESSREQSVASSSGKGKAPASKHRKTERPKRLSTSDLRILMEEVRAIGTGGGGGSVGMLIELDKERLKQITRREQVLEERENSFQTRWLEMERALDEKLKKREQEFDEKLRKREQELDEKLGKREEELEMKYKWRMEELELDRIELRAMQKEFQETQKAAMANFVVRFNITERKHHCKVL
ncbi:hypothetical protein EC968_003001 [Mortierella alpina]|nr:hypothetical protein EC968_003001 [Mortierella alpina]